MTSLAAFKTVRTFFVALSVTIVTGLVCAPAHAAITASKSIAAGFPSTINPGDPTRFQITLSNDNTASAVNTVAFNDDMTAQSIFIGPNGLISNTCSGAVTATPGTSVIDLAGGTIPIAPPAPPGSVGSCDIIVEVSSTLMGGSRVNTIATGAVTGDDGVAVANTTPAVQSFTVLTLLRPTIAKSFSPTALVENDQTSTLTITVTNPNSSANIPLTTVTDSLPAGVEVASAPTATVNCTGTGASNGTFIPSPGDTTVTLSGGAIGISGVCTLSVRVIGTNSGASGSNLVTNTLLAADIVNTRALTPAASASANLTINSPLRLTKEFAINRLRAGQQSTLTITIFNDSPTNPLTITTFTDDPIGATGGGESLLVTAAPSTTCSGGGVAATGGNTGITLTGGTIAALGNCTITIPFTATLGAAGVSEIFTNTIAAGAVGNTDGLTSRPVSQTVTVNDQLVVVKSVNPSTAAAGNPVNYSVSVRNFTPGALSAVAFTDNFPGGMIALATPAPAVTGAGCNNFSKA